MVLNDSFFIGIVDRIERLIQFLYLRNMMIDIIFLHPSDNIVHLDEINTYLRIAEMLTIYDEENWFSIHFRENFTCSHCEEILDESHLDDCFCTECRDTVNILSSNTENDILTPVQGLFYEKNNKRKIEEDEEDERLSKVSKINVDVIGDVN